MRTLAERLGVTKTTISLALRDHPSISQATRDRVKQLAKELNYRPDPALAAIAATRWSSGSLDRHVVIAFLCHNRPDGEFPHPRYLKGAQERASELGYKLETFFVDEYPSAKAASRVLYSRGIRGILVSPVWDLKYAWTADMEWEKFTAVCCGIGWVRPPLHTVTKDVFGTTRLVWEIAAEAGFKRIGGAINCHRPLVEDDWLRFGASSASIGLLGLNNDSPIPLLSTQVEDERALMEWYERYKPDLIIGFNFYTGQVLEKNGVRIPEDVEFLSLITQPGSKWSGIDHCYEHIARISIDVLHDEMRDNRWGLPDLPNLVVVDAEWNSGTTFTHPELARSHFEKRLRKAVSSEDPLNIESAAASI